MSADHLNALYIRTKVIGAGNSFQVLIPLAEIDAEGQTYRVIMPSKRNKEYVLFEQGIAPYVGDIIRMPQGFERYDRYLAHEKVSKVKALAILQKAFPESELTSVPLLWDDRHLPDAEAVIKVDRAGDLVADRPARRHEPVRGLGL